MNLRDYFVGLAPKGETALIVRQKATGGFHLDGSPKYTWPAYMPSYRGKEGDSLFLNTDVVGHSLGAEGIPQVQKDSGQGGSIVNGQRARGQLVVLWPKTIGRIQDSFGLNQYRFEVGRTLYHHRVLTKPN